MIGNDAVLHARIHPKADVFRERGSTCDVIQWGCGLRNKNSGTAMREQKIPIDTKNCAPTSRVLQDLMSQVPSEYVTVGWLTSSLHGRSLGTIMLCFGLLAMTPVGSTVPGLILAVMALRLITGSAEPVFPHLIAARRLPAKQLLGLGSSAIHVLQHVEKAVHPRWPTTFALGKRSVGVFILLLSVVLLLTPVPLSNLPPAIVISLIALAYIEEDGLLLCATLLAAIILIGIAAAALWAAIVGALLVSA
jgi:hypothetical protein